MKTLIILLALTFSGCFFADGAADPDYTLCLDALAPAAPCDMYYLWVPGLWTLRGDFVPGYYRLRDGYHYHYYNHHNVITRDHRRWRR